MHHPSRTLGVLAVAGGIAISTVVVSAGVAGPSVDFTNVPAANPKVPGYDPPNVLSPQLQEIEWARGSTTLENGIPGVVKSYGYDDNGPFVPVAGGAPGALALPGSAQPPGQPEAQKTEPDKNTYLVLSGQRGADPNYDYGTHFLYQGHELGSPGYITRINLDADGPHRVTLLATQDSDGKSLPAFDGSTWDPWAQRLLFTSEAGPSAGVSQGGVWQATLGLPSTVVNLQHYLGRGGFEGIQNDDRGSLYIIEDVGGSTFPNSGGARRPNSFVYRFLPNDVSDLTKGGKIQALQVLRNAVPITFADGGSGLNPASYLDLHTYGTTLATKWITLATTPQATDPDDNALAKSMNATPFKRPENGLFQPGSNFTAFYFDETGDTNNMTQAAATGGFGSIFRLTQSPTSDSGTISLFYLGNSVHAGFDNNAFFSDTQLAFVEDAGDTLHTQRSALDSGWLFDTTSGYANPGSQPIRFLAEGRDPSATLDSSISAVYAAQSPSQSFYNEGDNEITGVHVSDGDPTKNGVLGAKSPKPFRGDGQWRAFFTQQHGDNVTYELIGSNTK